MSRNLEFETNIIWLEDKAQFPYVREFHPSCSAKKGWAKKWGCGRRVVAYAELSNEVRTIQRRVTRRAWYFADHDPYPGNDKPSEGVIPSSITAGKESKHGRVAIKL
jgi:hypothetical protein